MGHHSLFNNLGDINYFKYTAIEIKYSKRNLKWLVKHLERDKKVLEKFIPKADEKKLVCIEIINIH